jgi:hypothetical protein
MIEEANKLDI